MRLIEARPLTAFFSIIIIISTLFTLVFLQMEERRIGYEILKLNKELKTTTEKRRLLSIKMAQISRPQQIENIAKEKGSLLKADHSQIINLGNLLGIDQ